MSMTETATPLRKKKSTQNRLVTIKVSLRGSKPPIWRRLVMAASSSLADLNFAIQDSMGWGNCHLHAFEIDGRTYGVIAQVPCFQGDLVIWPGCVGQAGRGIGAPASVRRMASMARTDRRRPVSTAERTSA